MAHPKLIVAYCYVYSDRPVLQGPSKSISSFYGWIGSKRNQINQVAGVCEISKTTMVGAKGSKSSEIGELAGDHSSDNCNLVVADSGFSTQKRIERRSSSSDGDGDQRSVESRDNAIEVALRRLEELRIEGEEPQLLNEEIRFNDQRQEDEVTLTKLSSNFFFYWRKLNKDVNKCLGVENWSSGCVWGQQCGVHRCKNAPHYSFENTF